MIAPDSSWDEALTRLEDVLEGYPFDRALPDLRHILAQAGVPERMLHEDDRALKVLHEAVVARPYASSDAVAQARTEIELLTVEVRVLTERLADYEVSAEEVETAAARLAEVRDSLDRLRRHL